MLVNSTIFPSCGLLVLEWSGRLIGLAAMLLIDAPKPGVVGGQIQRHAFVHSVYIDSYLPDDPPIKVPGKAGEVMCLGMEQWGKNGGATYIYGNVRMDGNLGALYRKFGWSAQHYVVGKEFKDG
jgi:hypothetical protein